MNEQSRHRKLLAELESKQILSTQQIIELLDISPATARRDINKLNEQQKLKKVRNGAEAISHNAPLATELSSSNSDEKQRIVLAASQLCKEGDSVLLTSGSTMLLLGNTLCGRELQIMTNFLPLANALISQDHEDVVIIGGQFNKDKQITLSLNPQRQMLYSVNIMFTSGSSFTEQGLFKSDMIIAHSESQMRAKAHKYVVLLDSSKLGVRSGMLFTELAQVDLLITGKEADPEIIRQLREKGLEIILA